MNKKASIINLWSVIIFFVFFTLIGVFSSVLIYNFGDENILTPIHNVTKTTGAVTGISDDMNTAIDSYLQDYRDFIVPYDLYFLLSFIGFFIFSVISSIKAREESILSFFGLITFGLIIFLSLVSVIVVIKDWFVLNFITNLLEFDIVSTPIINFYLSNIAIISFTWALILALLNKLNFGARESNQNDINLQGGDFQQ